MEIGIKIKRLREHKKVSQMELSTILGISQTKLCNIESNEDKSIDIVLMKKVCHYFDVGFHYFLGEETHPNREHQRHPITGMELHNNFPESIIAEINFLIVDNKFKERQIKELLARIAELESQKRG